METGSSNWDFSKFWPYENDGFDFISVSYAIKSSEPVYDTEIRLKCET